MSRNHGYMIYDTLFGTDENAQDQAADGRELDRERRPPAVDLQAAQGPGVPRRQAGHRRGRDRLAAALGQARRDGRGADARSSQRMDSPAPDTFRIFLGEACGFVLEALGKPSSNVPFIMPKRVAETDAVQADRGAHRLRALHLQARRVQARRQGGVPEEREVRAAQRAAVGHAPAASTSMSTASSGTSRCATRRRRSTRCRTARSTSSRRSASTTTRRCKADRDAADPEVLQPRAAVHGALQPPAQAVRQRRRCARPRSPRSAQEPFLRAQVGVKELYQHLPVHVHLRHAVRQRPPAATSRRSRT